MELRTGYKQTEVGVIPEDWETSGFGKVFHKISTRGHQLQTHEYRVNGKYPIIDQGKALVAGYSDRSERVLECPTDGLVVFGDHTRRVKYINFDFIVGADGTQVLSVVEGQSAVFLYYQLATKEIPNTGYNRHFKFLKEMVFALPPLPEQRAIAAALGDVDAQLAALDAQLTKQRALKQAAMQQLLTGRTRLPGFAGEWETRQLGSLGTFASGSGFPTRYQGKGTGTYPFYKVSDMNNEGNELFMSKSNNWIDESVRAQIRANTIPAHSIVFAKIGAAVFLERKKILTQESCIDNNMMNFVPNTRLVDYRFAHYVLLNTQLGKYVAATALPSLSAKDLATIEFASPSIAEQAAITIVLSDMDAGIAALEARIAKTRQLKQAMMQELLTGRTRLT